MVMAASTEGTVEVGGASILFLTSRDCGIPALYLLPEIQQNNEAEILPPHDHQKLAQTHFCFLNLFQYFECLLSIRRCRGLKILDALQFYIYNYILRFVVKVFQGGLIFLLSER